MIIDPNQPGSPVDERSALKGSNGPRTSTAAGPSDGPPPPPYAPRQSYSGVPPTPPPHTLLPNRDSSARPVLKRMLKAYLVAILVIILWSVLVDSVGKIVRNNDHKRGIYSDAMVSMSYS